MIPTFDESHEKSGDDIKKIRDYYELLINYLQPIKLKHEIRHRHKGKTNRLEDTSIILRIHHASRYNKGWQRNPGMHSGENGFAL
ncbi:hypothetical protein Dfri01_56840 [Dyadobacter frigoris]|nr:hypothetical protein Dfri01_56840 [Dyadobacter frigoris]